MYTRVSQSHREFTLRAHTLSICIDTYVYLCITLTQGVHFTCGHNNIHSSVSGIQWHTHIFTHTPITVSNCIVAVRVVCMCIYIYMYVYIQTLYMSCVCVYTYICMYVYIHIHICIHTHHKTIYSSVSYETAYLHIYIPPWLNRMCMCLVCVCTHIYLRKQNLFVYIYIHIYTHIYNLRP